jgi:hypothetical protein
MIGSPEKSQCSKNIKNITASERVRPKVTVSQLSLTVLLRCEKYTSSYPKNLTLTSPNRAANAVEVNNTTPKISPKERIDLRNKKPSDNPTMVDTTNVVIACLNDLRSNKAIPL